MSDSLRPEGTVAYEVPLSMGFSRQECWSGLPFPSSKQMIKRPSSWTWGSVSTFVWPGCWGWDRSRWPCTMLSGCPKSPAARLPCRRGRGSLAACLGPGKPCWLASQSSVAGWQHIGLPTPWVRVCMWPRLDASTSRGPCFLVRGSTGKNIQIVLLSWTKTVHISTVCTWETMKFSLEFEQI